ncbi:hypothetical protein OJAV_G00049220 [Oryzias javanicus]|uniref:Podocalyxin-like protein 2 n=1 Tax=Oryzias javanicus TaxID=123683 RepID=A0A3S2PGV1_ORYJA|nr:hypothetical protein OJAV_G00049220 [Oryzias javanicus]
MPGLSLFCVAVLLCCWGGLSLDLSQPAAPPGLLFWRESPKEPDFIQDSVRSKRRAVGELVRAQPHLVHDMGWPEIYRAAPSPPTEPANSSRLNTPPSAPPDVVRTRAGEDMERMVHLAVPRQTEDFLGHPQSADGEAELPGHLGTVDVSSEASGFNGMDTEDRGEEGGEDQERRGKLEWENDRERKEEEVLIEENQMVDGTHEDIRDIPEVTHSTTDPHMRIDFAAALHSSREPLSSFPGADQDSGLQELQASPLLKWSSDGGQTEEDLQSSGFEALQPAVPSAAADVSGRLTGASTLETETETDFDLLGGHTREEMEGQEEGWTVNSQHPTEPEAAVNPSREPLQPGVERDGEVGRDSRSNKAKQETRIPSASPSIADRRELEPQQVVCLNWSELAGRGYVVLNMTDNMNCEDFRSHQGVQLLKIIERVFSQKMKSPEGSWVLYLSKPTHQQHQLLMNVASGHGVIASQEVLDMLGQIRKSLHEVGIQNYSAASTCQSRRSQSRSDYGKLFVVLVIIGSVCLVIITSGIIYICWQRRLPAAKTVFRAEELHHVENGYHDNPTLDVTNDSEAEMQEKKPSTNGLTGGGDGGGEDSSHWQGFINQAVSEEEEGEQDTHL